VEGHGFSRAVRSDKIAGFSPGVRQTLNMRRINRRVLASVVPCLIAACLAAGAQTSHADQEFLTRLSAAAIERPHHSVRYVSDNVRISYPGGEVPANTGVCTDEVIRSYRAVGIDLQKEVHEDMVRNLKAYPHKWQRRPDTNLDHRRVPNLMVFFSRKGKA
jgi:uncharacterized protein YijF (DUF1287 family)